MVFLPESSLMSDRSNAGLPAVPPIGHDLWQEAEQIDTEDSYQVLKDREVTPDLLHTCPICGHPYQPGERVLALACLSFATGAMSPSPEASSYDSAGNILLGHHECVLPRLLTLLASFRPDERFIRARSAVIAGEEAVPTRSQAQA
jgi:hypothetical protein